VIIAALLLGGLVVDFLAGRWWASVVPVAFGIWVGAESDVDVVPPWFLGFAYALMGVLGILVGVFADASRLATTGSSGLISASSAR
jgi:hypothetical protein